MTETVVWLVPVAFFGVVLVGGISYHLHLERMESVATGSGFLPERLQDSEPGRVAPVVVDPILYALRRFGDGLPARRHRRSGGIWDKECTAAERASVLDVAQMNNVGVSPELECVGRDRTDQMSAPRDPALVQRIARAAGRHRVGDSLDMTFEHSLDFHPLDRLDALEVRVIARTSRAMLDLEAECEAFLESLHEEPSYA